MSDEPVRLGPGLTAMVERDVLLRKLAEAQTELARVAAERDRLIERWPGLSCGGVVMKCQDGTFATFGGTTQWHKTRTKAVRFAAGLDTVEAEHE